MIPTIITYLVITIYTALSLFSPPETLQEKPVPGESYLSLARDGAWCWFSDPRAIYFEGKFKRIYSGWIDHNGNVTVGFYDFASKTISSHILHNALEIDDHDNPSLLMTNDGRIMVFYSRHASSSPIYKMISLLPENIDQWEDRQELYLNDTLAYPGLFNSYTYTNVCRLSAENNRFYIFWRGMDFKPNFSTSSDGGLSWDRGRILILPSRTYDNRRPYIKVCSNNFNRIHFAFTDGHPRDEPTNSIYYMMYEDGFFYKAGREKITGLQGLPVNPESADLVYDAKKTEEKAWIWDIAEDKSGMPVIVYTRFKDNSNHIYYYARWDGLKWNNYPLINSGSWFPHTTPGTEEREPNYSGGIVLDHENPGIVYLSLKREKVFEIEKWTTPDQGKTWNNFKITENSMNDNVRPFVIRNLNRLDSVKVLWMNIEKYNHYTDYKSSIKLNIQ